MSLPSVKVRFQRLGKIRLGEKVAGARGEYPKATDHFIFDEGAKAVAKRYAPDGKPCTIIFPVLLPGTARRKGQEWDFTDFWKTSRSAYGKTSGLFCRTTDEVLAWRVNKGLGENDKPLDPQGFDALKLYEEAEDHKVETGEMFSMACPADECPWWEKKACKKLGSLDMMLPEVDGLGVWNIQTSSNNSIRNIESTLQLMAETVGEHLNRIPLALRLVPQQAQVEGRAKTIFVLELLCPHNLQQLAGLRRKAIASGGSIIAMIEGPDPVPDEFFANAGADLDKELKTPLAPGQSPPPASTDEARAREIGAALGMSKAQVEIAVRKAGKDLPNMVDTWERQLEEKGGAVESEEVERDEEAITQEAREIFAERPIDGDDRPTAAASRRPPPERTPESDRRVQEQSEAAARNQAPYRRERELANERRPARSRTEREPEPLIAPHGRSGSAYDV